ncbi:glycosyl transferase family 28 [Actinomadura craniellae]|uniref:Glycosyl transferase family 28 n=1 Tax=Actinomadura craniellae TaxID=2231787 RepID=A0A365H0U7_9ACTN|nr:activator-dependent family glycosyltransferase [Actinomadura craniellae]RAY12712.1 glycosyl transferase family 28 [Actinomadura craniellae]
MRVLFLTVAEKAHAYPQVPLAWALRAAGHEVCVVGQPDVVDDITRAGLTAVPIGASLDLAQRVQEGSTAERQDDAGQPAGVEAAEDAEEFPDPTVEMPLDELRPEKLTHDHMQGLFATWVMIFQEMSNPDLTDELVEFARGWGPDLVIWDPLLFAGGVAARACGAAHARMLYGLDLIGRMRGRFVAALAERSALVRDDPMAEWLDLAAECYGGGFGEDLVMGQWTIDSFPGSMRFPVDHHYVPVRYVPYNGPSVLPGWLREPPKRPRVCLSLGLSFRESLGGDRMSVGELLEAVAGLDVEVVATLDAEQLATVARVPDNVRAVDFVSLNELLPTCSAIVHHGGFGSSQTALAHGVPQIALPSEVWDIEVRAQRIEQAGAGLCVPRSQVEEITADRLKGMLVRVLEEPSFARNAARLRTEMRGTPAPADIVPLLEKLTAEHSRPEGSCGSCS